MYNMVYIDGREGARKSAINNNKGEAYMRYVVRLKKSFLTPKTSVKSKKKKK